MSFLFFCFFCFFSNLRLLSSFRYFSSALRKSRVIEVNLGNSGPKKSIMLQIASSDSSSSSYPCKIRQPSWSSFCSKHSNNWWTPCHDLFPKLVCELGLGHFNTSQRFLYAWICYFISINRFDIYHSRMGLPQIRSNSRRWIVSRIISTSDIITGNALQQDRKYMPNSTVKSDFIRCQ